ncbi:OLC1v1032088C1 [Oldenlandia corymbosa var. corymbosa]|uniref:OLC1v1032088C1 n=1 Tax=Oldenlandia corymbosa var. corymbosa TaxID=529605 RepID=A0AAV1CK63_OLDCO|nr:OLC1v1032088C1 [Oldenlandia corymbosa var. corymbosa]
MVSLNCISMSKLNIQASTLPNKASSSSSSIPHQASSSSSSPNSASPVQLPPQSLQKLQNQQLKPKQKKDNNTPTILEIERAIGAEENEGIFETIFSRTIGKTEGPIEKQLRETGEWINDKTERQLRAAGKPILMFMYQWILPMWILAFCIASGIIKLPFHNAFLDDLLM